MLFELLWIEEIIPFQLSETFIPSTKAIGAFAVVPCLKGTLPILLSPAVPVIGPIEAVPGSVNGIVVGNIYALY